MTWYVVHHGRQSGVFSSWEECHAQVNGFKGACYKGYKSKHEAVAAYNNQIFQAELKLANFENKKKCDFTCKDAIILVLVVIIIILLCKMM